MEQTEKFDIYQKVTDDIIAQLEKGTIPWKQPWTIPGIPRNLISNKAYRGINLILLAMLGYKQNYFLTFDQVRSLKGKVTKGSKSHWVVFWKQIEVDDKENPGQKITRPFLRFYNVFNIAQCENLPEDKIPTIETRQNDPIMACEEIIHGMPNRPKIVDIEEKAFYQYSTDIINVPHPKHFKDAESYYAILFHELIHSSGHTSRLNRKELMDGDATYGTEAYSKEELTAEIGACFLCSIAGIPTKNIENQSAYIAFWLNKLKNDKKFIVYAAAQAQKAVDYILGVKKEDADKDHEPQNVEEVVDELPF